MCNTKTRIKINKGIFAINEIAGQCFPIYTLAKKTTRCQQIISAIYSFKQAMYSLYCPGWQIFWFVSLMLFSKTPENQSIFCQTEKLEVLVFKLQHYCYSQRCISDTLVALSRTDN